MRIKIMLIGRIRILCKETSETGAAWVTSMIAHSDLADM